MKTKTPTHWTDYNPTPPAAGQAAHTPGPWQVHGDETQQAHYIHGANKVCDIAKPSGFYRSPRETEANARLIAAAPELLAALEAGEKRADLVAASMHFSDPLALREELRLLAIGFRAALAKAKGAA